MKLKNTRRPSGVICYIIAYASNGSFLAYASSLDAALKLQDEYLKKGIDTLLTSRV